MLCSSPVRHALSAASSGCLRFGATCTLALLEACYAQAVPALIPFAFLSLLTTQGTEATDIVLNGLQVTAHTPLPYPSHTPPILYFGNP